MAWAVHLFTALGAVAGLLAIIAIAHHEWRMAFSWMGVTLAVDSVDGMLARACRVKQVLPHFDGALLDNMVDYFTYVIVPACFLYEARTVPMGCNFMAATAITLASAYQFCQAEAKTKDHFFMGFPSYWNIVVFYLFLLEWPEWVNLVIILLLAIGVFVPVKYLYPSRTPAWRPLTLTLSCLWGALMVLVLVRYPQGHRGLLYASLAFVAYYGAMSAYLTLRPAPPLR